MKAFWKKHKVKLLAAAAVVAVLAAAFYIGGNAPDSKGWTVNAKPDVAAGSARMNKSDAARRPPATDAGSLNRPAAGTVDSAASAAKPTTEEEEALTSKPTTVDEEELTPAFSTEPEEGPTTEPAEEASATPVPEATKPTTTPAPETAKPTTTPTPETSKPTATPAPETTKPTTTPAPETTKPAPTPAPETAKPTPTPAPEPQEQTCTISIACSTILNNMDYLTPGKEGLVPAGGYLLDATAVSFTEGESVMDVLKRVTQENGIHLEYEFTPMYNSYYVEGIGNLYEFDCGELSGWMYSVNDWFPNYGCSAYTLSDGDVIQWVYTCDLGADVGGKGATQR